VLVSSQIAADKQENGLEVKQSPDFSGDRAHPAICGAAIAVELTKPHMGKP
jgi:hypothetical protein